MVTAVWAVVQLPLAVQVWKGRGGWYSWVAVPACCPYTTSTHAIKKITNFMLIVADATGFTVLLLVLKRREEEGEWFLQRPATLLSSSSNQLLPEWGKGAYNNNESLIFWMIYIVISYWNFWFHLQIAVRIKGSRCIPFVLIYHYFPDTMHIR